MKAAWDVDSAVFDVGRIGVTRVFETPFTVVNLIGLEAGQQLENHRTSSTAVIQVLTGTVTVTSGDEVLTLGPGQAVVMAPDQEHGLTAEGRAVVQLILSPHPRYHTLGREMGLSSPTA